LADSRAEVDTLLLVRGGGSLEDLWGFNDERVVRAVVACALPIICGVGHETDLSLADLAADLRAPTPTAAAELATPSRDELLERLHAIGAALQRTLTQRLHTQAQRLDTLALRLGRPARALAPQQQRVQSLAQRLRAVWALRRSEAGLALPDRDARLTRAISARLAATAQALDARRQRLGALDPHAVLARGYAWIEGPDGRPVASVDALVVGQRVTGVWHDGRAQLRVDAVESTASAPTSEGGVD
jgi:exodeoxyribonuclease VII large subunit